MSNFIDAFANKMRESIEEKKAQEPKQMYRQFSRYL